MLHPFSGLLTDLYELTMAAGYLETGMDAEATFELFVRHLPPQRNYLVVAGIEHALAYLEQVQFTREEVDYLRRQPVFRHVSQRFFDWLLGFRFHGDVWAMPEGTVAFAGEPLLRVTAPIAEAQLVETYLLAAVHFETLVASKAARVVTAAAGRPVVEFGSRRAHGIEAGVRAARAAYLAGCAGTSNVWAGFRFGIPVFGTLAHSWVMAHPSEPEAFRRFLQVFPEAATLLVDTYDARRAIERLIAQGEKPAGIRLDSGNLLRDSRWARHRLRQAGWEDVSIFASGDLDEYRIARLLAAGAEIDAFGVGTALATSSDAPALGAIYKLVEVRRGGRVRNAAKFSPAKATFPGRKQVYRFRDSAGLFREDLIALADEPAPGAADALLVEMFRAGRRVRPADSLEVARQRCREQLQALPVRLRRIDRRAVYRVRHSRRLRELFERLRRGLR